MGQEIGQYVGRSTIGPLFVKTLTGASITLPYLSKVVLSRQGQTGTGGLPTRPPRAVRKLFCRADADTRHARPPSPPMARHHHGPRCRTPQLGCHGHFASARSRPEVGDHPGAGSESRPTAEVVRAATGRDGSRSRGRRARSLDRGPRRRCPAAAETGTPGRGRGGAAEAGPHRGRGGSIT